jgi:outer membrane protein OmpA-like peptidoglycan-associated protein
VTLRDHARAARGAPAGFAEAADFLLRQVARLGPGATATLRDRTLTLQGEATNVDAYEAVRADLGRPPAGFVLGDGAPEPATVKPFTWAATRAPDGSIRLSGHTVSETERAAILGAARVLANGAPVEDAMRTARGLPAGVDARALTERAFAALALVRDGSVTLEGSALSVRGAAIDAQAVQEADALTTGSLPDGVTRGSVDLTASPVSPYVVGIRRAGETVTVTGHLPTPESRAALLAALRPHFFGERILDLTRLAEGAPPDLLRALQGAAAPLGQLAAGEVTATDQVLRIAGESLYPESARRLSASGDRLAPSGWRAEVAVTARDAPRLLDADACRTGFDARFAARTVRFAPGSADLEPDFYPLLDDLAALARSCPDERIEVAGHVDPPGAAPPPAPKPPPPAPPKGKAANAKKAAEKTAQDKPAQDKPIEEKPAETAMPDVALPQRRAAAIVDYLLKAGVPAQRVGPGPAETMAERRAVAFAVSRTR